MEITTQEECAIISAFHLTHLGLKYNNVDIRSQQQIEAWQFYKVFDRPSAQLGSWIGRQLYQKDLREWNQFLEAINRDGLDTLFRTVVNNGPMYILEERYPEELELWERVDLLTEIMKVDIRTWAL